MSPAQVTAIAGLSTSEIRVDGQDYILTVGTGERSYGVAGGALAFAYDAEDFRDVAGRVTSYEDLFDELDTIYDEHELRRIAIAAAVRNELRVTTAGSCRPVLSDEEYALVRETVALLLAAVVQS